MNGNLITWAREREGLSIEKAAKKLGIKSARLERWEDGTETPNFNQKRRIASKFYVPLSCLFMKEPPVEKLPIVDFRTINSEDAKPSPRLLEVIYDAQRKQNWLSEIRRDEQVDPIITEGGKDRPVEYINKLLDIENLRRTAKNYEDFLRELITQLDDKGFIVIRNSRVGFNNSRPLSEREFRGFALHDPYAPLVFINGKDATAGQIFTLVHELAHLVLGESGLDARFDHNTEQNCNQIAAEVLLPSDRIIDLDCTSFDAIKRTAKSFRISTFVVLIKAKQLGKIDQELFDLYWQRSKAESNNRRARGSSGGNFYTNVKFVAGGESFLKTVRQYTLVGQMLYRDAYQLTGLYGDTFENYFKSMDSIRS